jgi:hypothetical protein
MLEKLPFNILLEIMGEDVGVALNLILALPKFGRLSLHYQAEIQKPFSTIKHNEQLQTISYLLNGKLHRVDGPAFTLLTNGYNEWRLYGKLHRVDGPATENPLGGREWWINGVLHRPEEEGPAVEHVEHQTGYNYYFSYGKLHREGGPAIETKDGSYRAWYLNGLRHRLEDNGPAVIRIVEGDFEYKEWWKYDELHRDGGPAIIRPDSYEWYKNGFLYYKMER